MAEPTTPQGRAGSGDRPQGDGEEVPSWPLALGVGDTAHLEARGWDLGGVNLSCLETPNSHHTSTAVCSREKWYRYIQRELRAMMSGKGTTQRTRLTSALLCAE